MSIPKVFGALLLLVGAVMFALSALYMAIGFQVLDPRVLPFDFRTLFLMNGVICGLGAVSMLAPDGSGRILPDMGMMIIFGFMAWRTLSLIESIPSDFPTDPKKWFVFAVTAVVFVFGSFEIFTRADYWYRKTT